MELPVLVMLGGLLQLVQGQVEGLLPLWSVGCGEGGGFPLWSPATSALCAHNWALPVLPQLLFPLLLPLELFLELAYLKSVKLKHEA